MKLSATKIKNADKGTHGDGQGLMLVKKDKSKGKWIFRFTLNGKRRDMGLGSWPAVSLADARGAADAARKDVAKGINPIQARKTARVKRQGVPTLQEAAEAAFKSRRATFKNEGRTGRWMSPLKTHVFPKYGSLPITDIDQDVVVDILSPIWRAKHPTASKAAERIQIALKYAKAQKHPVETDAVELAKIILGDPNHKVEHRAAMPWREVPAFYQSLNLGTATQRVLKFMILTGGGGRSSPVRTARYDQIDGDQWMIPGTEMKGREGKTPDFRIPLSEPALELIEACKALTGGEWLFPGPSGKPITDSLTSEFMREACPPYVPHGFRSSFRDWMAHTDVPFEIAETAIAHQIGTDVTRAYLRDDYWEKRKVIMHNWANHLLGNGSAKVLELKAD